MLRYAPVPWSLKRRLLWLTQPKVIVVGVAVIPDHTGRVLMLRSRYSGRWQLPGGVIKAGEDPWSGTMRECREELGLQVAMERLSGVYADPFGAELAFCFHCRPLTRPPALSAEHEAFRYTEPVHMTAKVRQMVDDALTGQQVRIGVVRYDTRR